MITAYLALGSNLNHPEKQILKAIDHIKCIKDSRLTGQSSLYQSKPLDNSLQNDYINAAVRIETKLSPQKLFQACQLIENKLGKLKLYHWGPRSIDIDIILYDHYELETHELTIPHPGLTERDFVIKPLLDIDSEITLPNGKKLSGYLDTCKNNELKCIELINT